MEFLSDRNEQIVNRSDALETATQPRLRIVKRLTGFFSFTQEDRLKAGIDVRSDGDGDEHTVSSYFLRAPSDRIDSSLK